VGVFDFLRVVDIVYTPPTQTPQQPNLFREI